MSGITIVGNTFVNVSRVFHLGGGRDNLFLNNSIANVTRGCVWAPQCHRC